LRLVPVGRDHFSQVDDADYGLVSQYKWHVIRTRNGVLYAGHTINFYLPDGRRTCKILQMHRLLTGWPMTDHVDRDGLNNQRCNLRPTGSAGNRANARERREIGLSSKFKGVSAHQGRWRARIRHEGHEILLGVFADERDAARAYDVAALHIFGEFACTNADLGLL
jgi:hypothetical protein